MSRYDQLIELINHHKPQSIIEIGTWNGLRAIAMATAALQHQPQVHYLGFDLFEDATEETDAEENNVKRHFSAEQVQQTLERFQAQNSGFSFQIVKGNTKDTLSPGSIEHGDFAFIDGGHSIETIAHDFECLKSCKVVVLDDWYEQENGQPDIERFGCNKILQNVDALVMPAADPVKGGGKVRMAVVPRSAYPGKVNLVVKTKNCVSDKHIQANVRYACSLVDRWIEECRPNDLTAVIVAAGPSFREYLEEIKKASRRKKTRVFCVKHSHDKLLENNIVPYGCLLLDPRPHVKETIDHPDERIKYFVASMCHPVTLDALEGYSVWGYHAHVGAGEVEVLKEFGPGIAISGGSTAGVRGISLLHALGFRKFVLYGFDSCYRERPEKAHGIKEKPVYEVDVNGRKFLTDSELLAQAQDFNKLIRMPHNIELDIKGDGMIAHIWDVTRRALPHVDDIIG